jgi:hypothetical protein
MVHHYIFVEARQLLFDDVEVRVVRRDGPTYAQSKFAEGLSPEGVGEDRRDENRG